MEQNRWKSKYLWMGIVSIILSMLIRFGGLTIADSEFITQTLNTLFDMLAFVGVVNNPTSKENW